MVQPTDRRLITEQTFLALSALLSSAVDGISARVRGIETLGGLTPGSTSDAAMAVVAANKDSQFSQNQRKHFASVLTPEEFGAVGDGVADDTSAVQKWLAAVRNGDTFQARAGARYRLTAGVVLQGKSGFHWGAGGDFLFDSTTASAQGGISAIRILDCVDAVVDALRVEQVNQSQQYNGITVGGSSTRVTLNQPYAFNFRWVGIGANSATRGIKFVGGQGLQCMHGGYSAGDGTIFDGGRYSSEWSKTLEFTAKGGVWDASSKYYDGIIIAGRNWVIRDVTLDDCGQSGIYGGGSNGNVRGKIFGCNIFGNWNKGIDLGIVGAKTATNYIREIIMMGNDIRDNATGNLHIAGVDDSIMTANTCVISSTASTTPNIVVNGPSINNLIQANPVISANQQPAIFVNDAAGSKDNKVLDNPVTAPVPYQVNRTRNVVRTLSATGMALATIEAMPRIDLSRETGAAGRKMLDLIGAADSSYVEIQTNSKELRVVNPAGTSQDFRGGLITADRGLTVGSGPVYFNDSVRFRLPRTPSTNPGEIWYDPADSKLKWMGAGNVIRSAG